MSWSTPPAALTMSDCLTLNRGLCARSAATAVRMCGRYLNRHGWDKGVIRSDLGWSRQFEEPIALPDGRKLVSHPWLGGPRRLTMYLATLGCAISNPSLSSSPWMRGAPQSGFSTLIRRINTRSSVSICGRPPCGRDFQRQ